MDAMSVEAGPTPVGMPSAIGRARPEKETQRGLRRQIGPAVCSVPPGFPATGSPCPRLWPRSGIAVLPNVKVVLHSPYNLLGCRSAGLKWVGQAGRAGCRSRRSCGTRFIRSCREAGSNLTPLPCNRGWPRSLIGLDCPYASGTRNRSSPEVVQLFVLPVQQGFERSEHAPNTVQAAVEPIPAYAIPFSICGARKERVVLVVLGRNGWRVAASSRRISEVGCQSDAGAFNHPEPDSVAGNHLHETLLATPFHDGCREAPQRAR